MPWDIRENFGSCTGFAVVKQEDDEVEGCHDTREEAQAQLAALNAAESDNDNDDNAMQNAETEEEKRKRRARQARQRPEVQGYNEHGNAVLDLSERVEYLEEPTFKSQQ